MPVPQIIDGDARFGGGLDSFSENLTLAPGKYIWAENLVNRGGVLQTRPGFRTRIKLPDGKLQGLTTYYPSQASARVPQLIAIVSGNVYASEYPYRGFRQIGGASLSATAKRVYTVNTIKAVQRNADNSLRLIQPQSIMVFQDGLSPACYYDGVMLRPSVGTFAIPQGTIMCWAGNRLWVARREKLFAGDIGDPLSFREQTFNLLGGVQCFLLPGEITAMHETPGVNLPQLLVFTDRTTSTFRSDVYDRSQWNSINPFQRKIFPRLGCVSQRSITSIGGTLYWFSLDGVTTLDTAEFNSQATKVRHMDNELIRSKSRLGADWSGVAGIGFDNFLLMSVPHAGKFNRHTWVMDSSSEDLMTNESPACWSSIWTGVQPVEWTNVTANGVETIFCASADPDGHNRIYEAFTSDRRDNGVDIPWAAEIRALTGGSVDKKRFRYAEYMLSELVGEVNLRISWAGAQRGQWKACSVPTFKAREGSLSYNDIIDPSTPIFAFKKQSRLARTNDILEVPEGPLSAAGVEGPVFNVEPSGTKEAIDTAFAFRIEGSGPCGLREFKVYMDPVKPADSGQRTTIETGDPAVRFDGAASKNAEDLDAPLEIFSSTKSETARYKNYASTKTATVQSLVSQADADKRASQSAREAAEVVLRSLVPKRVGGSKL